MKKGDIIFYGFVILVISLILIGFTFGMLLPGMEYQSKIDKAKILFKESDFGIPKKYSIYYSKIGFNPYINQFKETNWFYINTIVYITDKPYLQNNITLWVNIDTKVCYYVGNLP